MYNLLVYNTSIQVHVCHKGALQNGQIADVSKNIILHRIVIMLVIINIKGRLYLKQYNQSDLYQ